MSYKRLYEDITYTKKSAWDQLNKKEIFQFCEKYKSFLKDSKTVRRCVNNLIFILKKNGFKELCKNTSKIVTGDKFYQINKDKSIIAFIVGKDKEHLKIIGSHMDSPRLDLKPNPIYEDSGLALIRTHYYGGIKKYHWVNEPLILEGVIYTKKGKKINLSLSDTTFMIPDLLPHLARDQMKKEGAKIVEGETLNVLAGNIPIEDNNIKEKVKFTLLKNLYEKYKITEHDFFSAELELVPERNPLNVGLDQSLIGAYGQDDKVCVYTSLKALIEIKKPEKTIVGFYVDKEEIGSMGNTGAQSNILINFVDEYIKQLKLKTSPFKILKESQSISADVTAGLNPNYKDVHESQNASFLGNGVSVEKYGGGGGKYSTNDTNVEYVSYIRNLLEKNKIPFQYGELGKIDVGGGGTIAMFMSRYGMDCIDIGPPLLGMHSPFEISSKVDIYCSYLIYKEFYKSKV